MLYFTKNNKKPQSKRKKINFHKEYGFQNKKKSNSLIENARMLTLLDGFLKLNKINKYTIKKYNEFINEFQEYSESILVIKHLFYLLSMHNSSQDLELLIPIVHNLSLYYNNSLFFNYAHQCILNYLWNLEELNHSEYSMELMNFLISYNEEKNLGKVEKMELLRDFILLEIILKNIDNYNYSSQSLKEITNFINDSNAHILIRKFAHSIYLIIMAELVNKNYFIAFKNSFIE